MVYISITIYCPNMSKVTSNLWNFNFSLSLYESVNGLFVINLNFCNPENVPKPLILQFISKFEIILNG